MSLKLFLFVLSALNDHFFVYKILDIYFGMKCNFIFDFKF